MRQIYLDYNATTPVAPSVTEAMIPFLNDHYGNPSSAHSLGRAAKEAIEDARGRVAGLLACDREEVVFTGCGSESNNLAIKGVMFRHPIGSAHMVTSQIEHAAVTNPAKFLERLGYDVSYVPCDSNGRVSPAEVEAVLRRDTRLVSIMHANNEVGTLQPIREIAEICHDRGILMHTDASQSVGKVPAMVDMLDVDMLTLAGHKLYAPKGVGGLFVRDGISLEPLIHGAAHENGMRAGTENTPYIVGLGHAAYLATKCLDDAGDRMGRLRDRLEAELSKAVGGDLIINGHQAERLPNTTSVSFPRVTGHELLSRIPELCASTGSACHSGGGFVSATLSAMGVSEELAAGTVRLSVGWNTSEEEIDRAASLLIDAWENLQAPV